MYAQRRSCALALGRNALAIVFQQLGNSCGCVESQVRRFGDPDEKKVEPGFPSTVFAHFLQEPIVVRAMSLEVEAEVKKWAAQDAFDA